MLSDKEKIRIFSAEQMRNADRRTIESGVFTGIGLMENAGCAAGKAILETFGAVPYHILCGSGNNGGDGFVIASYLAEKIGADFITLHCMDVPKTADAAAAYAKVPPQIRQKHSFSAVPDVTAPGAVLIDCLLGTGFRPPLRPPFRQWIEEINLCRPEHRIVSVDIPSGLDADTGAAECAVLADMTLTFAALKSGLIQGKGAKHCGKIHVPDIGIPADIMEMEEDALEGIDRTVFRRILMKHRLFYDTYKQKRGHVLVIGGSADYPSAPFLSAEAALRCGAGLVSVAIPAGTDVFCSVPKALIVRRVPGAGTFCVASVPAILAMLEKADAVVIGPGMTAGADCTEFLAGLLPQIKCPVLLDADALNILAKRKDLFGCLNENTVLTPHAGELARLGTDSFGSAVLVRKGPYSTVTQNGRTAWNLSGSPALATAGSGDVLAGVIASFLAQGMTAFDAAGAGVFLHGLAGETENGLIADDLPRLCGKILHHTGSL